MADAKEEVAAAAEGAAEPAGPAEGKAEEGAEQRLNSTWVLWFHSLAEKRWSLDSYKLVYEIDTIECFWRVYNSVLNNMNRGRWYFMRKGVPPIWEAPENKNGGEYSYVLYGGNAGTEDQRIQAWVEVSMACIGEYLFCDAQDTYDDVVGVSYSPQARSAVIKIWNRDSKKGDQKKNKVFAIPQLKGRLKRYKAHKKRIKR